MLEEWLAQHATDPQIYCTWPWIFYAHRRAHWNSVTESFTCVSCCHILGSKASDGSQGRTDTQVLSLYLHNQKPDLFPTASTPTLFKHQLNFLATSSELSTNHCVSRRGGKNRAQRSSVVPSLAQLNRGSRGTSPKVPQVNPCLAVSPASGKAHYRTQNQICNWKKGLEREQKEVLLKQLYFKSQNTPRNDRHYK